MPMNTTITPELLDQLLANYTKPEDLTGDDGPHESPHFRWTRKRLNLGFPGRLDGVTIG